MLIQVKQMFKINAYLSGSKQTRKTPDSVLLLQQDESLPLSSELSDYGRSCRCAHFNSSLWAHLQDWSIWDISFTARESSFPASDGFGAAAAAGSAMLSCTKDSLTAIRRAIIIKHFAEKISSVSIWMSSNLLLDRNAPSWRRHDAIDYSGFNPEAHHASANQARDRFWPLRLICNETDFPFSQNMCVQIIQRAQASKRSHLLHCGIFRILSKGNISLKTCTRLHQEGCASSLTPSAQGREMIVSVKPLSTIWTCPV